MEISHKEGTKLNKAFLKGVYSLYAKENPEEAISLFSSLSQDGFLQAIQRHKLIGHLYIALEPYLENFVHAENFKKAYQFHVKRSFILMHEMERIRKAFNEKGITLLFFKGPMLSQKIYGNPFQRYSYDLDFIVSYQDVVIAISVLKELSYNSPHSFFTKNLENLNYFKRKMKNMEFHHLESGLCVELHWSLISINSMKNPIEDPFLSSSSVSFNGSQYLQMNHEDQAVYLILHAVVHKWFRYQLIHDIYNYLKLPETDIPALENRFHQLGYHKIWQQTLCILNKWYPHMNLNGVSIRGKKNYLEKLAYKSIRFWNTLPRNTIESYTWFLQFCFYKFCYSSNLTFFRRLIFAIVTTYQIDFELISRLPRWLWRISEPIVILRPIYKRLLKQ